MDDVGVAVGARLGGIVKQMSLGVGGRRWKLWIGRVVVVEGEAAEALQDILTVGALGRFGFGWNYCI